MVAHRVIDPKALIEPTKEDKHDKGSDVKKEEQTKSEDSQKAKTIEGEIKQNQVVFIKICIIEVYLLKYYFESYLNYK